MLAPTHVLFGLLAVSLTGLLAGFKLTPTAYACAILGALLPDLDTTASLVGRLAYPLAAFLERRFGHRGITHSLVGLTLASLVALPFSFLISPFSFTPWSAFLIGYASHLVADSMNKYGVPLFWPAAYQAVLPGNERYRLRAGSPAELALALALVPCVALSIPLNQMSLTAALHAVIRNVNSAVQDYQIWAGGYQVWVELDGRHNLSQQPVEGVFQVVGTAGVNAVVIRDAEGDIYAVGNSREDQILPHRIHALKGRPIRTEVREVRLTNQLLDDLFNYFPTADRGPLEVWIEGWFITTGSPIIMDDAGEFNRVKSVRLGDGETRFEVCFFTPLDLMPYQDVYVSHANFILRVVYPREDLP